MLSRGCLGVFGGTWHSMPPNRRCAALAGTLHGHTYTMAMEWAGLSVVYMLLCMANIGIGHIVCSLYVCMFKDIL